MKRSATLWILAAAIASGQVKEERQERHIIVQSEEVSVGGPHHAITAMPHFTAPVEFLSSEFAWEEKLVKGAPYSAEAVTESTQMLVDGNRISRKNTALVYRDGEGRTRREQTIEAIGPWASGHAHKSIFINDPVAGVNYILDPQNKTAMKISLPKDSEGASAARILVRGAMIGGAMPPPPGEVAGVSRELHFEKRVDEARHGGGQFIARDGGGAAGVQNYVNSSLGKQTIEGIVAEGTRTIVTIPAGEIGNDRPLETVSERWYSPDLQTVVMTKRGDPRAGESTYKLTNIRRNEPGKSLFEVPSEYTLREENILMRKILKKEAQ
jgi:hypothetical protein